MRYEYTAIKRAVDQAWLVVDDNSLDNVLAGHAHAVVLDRFLPFLPENSTLQAELSSSHPRFAKICDELANKTYQLLQTTDI